MLVNLAGIYGRNGDLPRSLDVLERRIAYERLGDPAAPLVMMMGIGAQLIAWPDGLCDALVARGLQLVRFDNRDAGRCARAESAGRAGATTIGVVHAVGHGRRLRRLARRARICERALRRREHGGFIAQTVAIEYPARVRSLTSIMATTGDPKVGQAHPDVLREFAKSGPATTREPVVARTVDRSHRRLAGLSADSTRSPSAGRAFDRAFDPIGMARQAVAVIASGDRTAKLRERCHS